MPGSAMNLLCDLGLNLSGSQLPTRKRGIKNTSWAHSSVAKGKFFNVRYKEPVLSHESLGLCFQKVSASKSGPDFPVCPVARSSHRDTFQRSWALLNALRCSKAGSCVRQVRPNLTPFEWWIQNNG